MRKGLLLLAVLLALTVPASAVVLVDDGFESGNLDGWTIVTNTPPGTSPQVFSAANPMEITEIYPNPDWRDGDDPPETEWLQRPSGLYATGVTPADGNYAVGWSRLGPYPNQQYYWISQYFQVAPGTYTLTAVWDAVCAQLERPDEGWALGAKGLVLVGSDYMSNDVVNDPLSDPSSLRKSLWSHDSNGVWVNKLTLDHQLTTADGRIEVRLAVHDKFDTESPNYQYVAFDNVYVELTPVPEPGSLMALAGGLMGLGGLAIRRRR